MDRHQRGLRAGCLLRVSTDRQERRKLSLELQQELTELACENLGLSPIIYHEGAISSRSKNRPKQKQLMTDLEAKRIDVLVLVELSRLGRPGMVTEVAEIVDFLHRVGAKVVECGRSKREAARAELLDLSIRRNYEEVRDALIAAGDEYERTFKRAVEGMLRAEEEGRPRILSSPPYWTEIKGHGVDAQILPIPERVALVQDMAERYLATLSLVKVADWLNHHQTYQGKRAGRTLVDPETGDKKTVVPNWNDTYVWAILTNPRLAGYEQYRRPESYRESRGVAMRKYLQENGESPGPSPLIESQYWPVIIERATWHKIQEHLKRPDSRLADTEEVAEGVRWRKRRISVKKWPLSGLLRCCYCGGPMWSSPKTERSSYVCGNKDDCQKGQSISKEFAHCLAHMIGLEYLQAWENRPRLQDSRLADRRLSLEQRLAELESQRKKIMGDWRTLGLREKEVTPLLNESRQVIEEIEVELEELKELEKGQGTDYLPQWKLMDPAINSDMEFMCRVTFGHLVFQKTGYCRYRAVDVAMAWGERFESNAEYVGVPRNNGKRPGRPRSATGLNLESDTV